MTPEEFLENHFFEKRDINYPDGRPIYAYKTKDGEFNLVKTILRDNKIDKEWKKCFFLFATEWWKREFDGGYWTWDGIFESLKISHLNTPQFRGALVQKGAEYWKRSIIQYDQRENEYLATFMAECGFPDNILDDEKHYLSKIISGAFHKLESLIIDDEDKFYIIDDLIPPNSPQYLRNGIFYKFIIELVENLIDLKVSYGLHNVEDPISCLEEDNSNWREKLPIRIQSGGAIDFFNNLLTNIVKKQHDDVTGSIQVQYILVKEHENWIIKTRLNFPLGKLHFEYLELSHEEYQKLTNQISFSIFKDSETIPIDSLAGNKISNDRIEISGENKISISVLNHDKWGLIIHDNKSDFEKFINLKEVYCLDSKEPWVFKYTDEFLTLIGSGSCKVNDDKAVLAYPQHAGFDSNNYQIIGHLENGYKICELYENSKISIDDCHYNIKLNSEVESNFKYSFISSETNDLINLYPRENTDIHVGIPYVRKIFPEKGIKVQVREKLQYFNKSENCWLDLSEGTKILGQVRVRLVDNEGVTVLTKLLKLVPKDLSIDHHTNSISINSESDFKIGVQNNPSDKIELEKEDHGYNISFLNDYPSDRLVLTLGGNDAKPLELTLPAPRYSECFIGKKHEILTNNYEISLNDIYGVSIVFSNLYGYRDRAVLIELIQKENDNNLSIKRTVSLPSFSTRNIPLIQLKRIFQKLFAFSTHNDDILRISFGQGGKRLNVTQFPIRIKPSNDTPPFLELSEQNFDSSVSLKAFSLISDVNSQTFDDLLYNEELEKWFIENNNQYDKLFVYPSSESKIQPRPIVLNIGETPFENEGLSYPIQNIYEASKLSYYDRQKALKDLFERIATEPDNSNWKFLYKIWEETKHLPLVTLDTWRVLSESPKGLAAACLYLSKDLIFRLLNDLGANFYIIPVPFWIEVFQTFEEQSFNKLPEELISSILADKLNLLAIDTEEDGRSKTSTLQLGALKEILKKHLSTIKGQPFPNLPESTINHMVYNCIYGEQDKLGLIGKAGDATWPDYLRREINKAVTWLPLEFKDIIPRSESYMRPTVLLPFILGYSSATNNDLLNHSKQDLGFKFYVKEIIEFDEEYFASVYDYIQGYSYLNQEKFTYNG